MSFAEEGDRQVAGLLEKAILVGIAERGRAGGREMLEEDLAELERLAHTAGAQVVARTVQTLRSPNPRTYVGKGKVEEIASLCRSHAADLVIFDEELSPAQQSNLEKIMPRGVKVIDRTALILDIFALHATTKEGRLQVRLAQNQYLLPRLRGMWAHLASNRMGGGVGSRFGEGESQLEVDRRLVRKRITSIRRELERLSSVRQVQRSRRHASGVMRIAEAGYTNAGKSSLINALTGSEVLSYDKLFATLDSTTRKLALPEGRAATLTDTVGFIRKLPTNLVEAFKSTLDEICEADLILHVIDASSSERVRQIQAVEETLEQIGAQALPVIEVFNKADLLDSDELERLKAAYPEACFVSAATGFGLDGLIRAIEERLSLQENVMSLLIPYRHGELVSLVHARCSVLEESYEEDGTAIRTRVPSELQGILAGFARDEASGETR